MKQQENIQPPSTDTNSLILQPKLVLRGYQQLFLGNSYIELWQKVRGVLKKDGKDNATKINRSQY